MGSFGDSMGISGIVFKMSMESFNFACFAKPLQNLRQYLLVHANFMCLRMSAKNNCSHIDSSCLQSDGELSHLCVPADLPFLGTIV